MNWKLPALKINTIAVSPHFLQRVRQIVRKFRLGECVTARLPDSKRIGTVKANVRVNGKIIALSPDSKFAKLLLDDDTELLIETRFLKS